MSFYLAKTGKNNWQGKFSSFPAEIAVHGISTRWGGKSSAPFASMEQKGVRGALIDAVLASAEKSKAMGK